jgi:hypothetical protein
VEGSLAERGRGDYYERIEGYCLTDGEGNVYVASVKWVFQVMEDGRRKFWFEGLSLGGLGRERRGGYREDNGGSWRGGEEEEG